MGLITGYDFVSFRIGSFTLIKENDKFVRKNLILLKQMSNVF